MKKIKALIDMIRPINAVMTAIGVVIGNLFTGSLSTVSVVAQVVAAIAAVGFGNVINDINDIETDRVAHPKRALPSGIISVRGALNYACFLGIVALVAGRVASVAHLYGVFVPLFLLIVYAIKLKGTPILGNVVVSLLVAYPLLFGAIGVNLSAVALPAILAFITNLIREIVKDIIDYPGDSRAGIVTTASLDSRVIYGFLNFLIATSFIALILPLTSNLFRLFYPIGTALVVIPLMRKGVRLYRDRELITFAQNLKMQLLAGLLLIGVEGIRSIFTAV